MAKITKAMLKEVREEMNKALEEVGKKYGVQFDTGNASFDEYSFTFKVAGKVTATEDGESVEKKEWDTNSWVYGLDRELFGKVLEGNFGQTFQILGLNPRSKKSPILLKDLHSGKEGRGSVEWVKTLKVKQA